MHPPIPTDGWTKDDVDRTAEQIHQFYVDTLEAWPGPGPAAYVGQRKKTGRTRARSGATSAPHPGPAPRAARTAPHPDPEGQ